MAEVLSSPSPHDGHSYLSTSSPLLRQSSSQSLFLGPPLHPVSRSPSPSSREGSSSEPVSRASSSISSSPPKDESPVISTSSFHSTPPSSLSLDTNNTTHEEDDNFLPTYDDNAFIKDDGQLPPPGTPDDSATNSASTTPEENDTDLSESDPESILNPVADDIAVREEPTKQVDYLSHDWREEDIWSSWKHIVSRRKVYGERSRLENASWRTWAKQKHKLKTVSPETLNWYAHPTAQAYTCELTCLQAQGLRCHLALRTATGRIMAQALIRAGQSSIQEQLFCWEQEAHPQEAHRIRRNATKVAILLFLD